ncbi:MAG: autotransporter-associated beta strand repeat-containing protein [Roseateles asaccharophilus]|uniref:autotransporter-associated beta strand repeat-containing protein n=1 Tax=Roseateles asaccharophilus TaxID=582607 RepID=UPI00391DC7C9
MPRDARPTHLSHARSNTARRAAGLRRLTLCSALAAAFAAPLSPATGATVIELTPLAPHTLFTPENTDLGASLGDVVYQGTGRLVKTGAGSAFWGARSATFALQAGSWIDVLEGRFVGGSSANENWSRNQASLHVAQGALFDGVEANVRVDALTGSGTIRTGFFDGHSSYGYQTFTLGVANGSGSFAGVLADGNSAGHFTKVGTGTQVLTGSSTYTGGTRVAGGTLAIGDGGSSGSILGPVQVDAGATLAFNRSDNTSFAGLISGEGRFIKQGSGTLSLSQGLNLQQGLEIQSGTLLLKAGANLSGPVLNQGTLELAKGAVLTLRDGISGAGTIVHTGHLLTMSGKVSAGLVATASMYEIEEGRTQLVLGEVGRSTVANIRIIVAGIESQFDMVGPQTQVFWKSEDGTGTGELFVDYGGQLRVRDGAQLSRDRATVRGGGQLTVQGAGSLFEVRGPSQPATLFVDGNGAVTVADGGRVVTDILWLDGHGSKLTVQGPGSSLKTSYLRASSHRSPQIQVLAGGLLESGEVNPRVTPFFMGRMLVSGAGSRWLHDGILRGGSGVANGQTYGSQLTIRDGGLFRARALEIPFGHTQGLSVLLDGGVLELTQAGRSFVSGLDWQQGRVILGGSTALNRDVLAQNLVLSAGRALEVQGDLQLNPGDALALRSGGQLQAHQLVLAGGSFEAQVQADFRSVLNWQHGQLVLVGDAELGQGLLAGRDTLSTGQNLRVQGRLSSVAGTPTLNVDAANQLSVLGELQLNSDLALGSEAVLSLGKGQNSVIQGRLSGHGTLSLSEATLRLAGPSQLQKLIVSNHSELRLEGAGSTLQLQDMALLGELGTGRISVQAGARLSGGDQELVLRNVGAPGAAQVLVSGVGSRLDAQRLSQTGVNLTVAQGGALSTSVLALRDGASLQAQDAGTQLAIGQLQLGSGTHLDLGAGAQLQGQQAWLSSSTAQLSGPGTRWVLSEGLHLDHSQVQLRDGARLDAAQLHLSGASSLQLHGGALRMERAEKSFVAGLDWTHGQLTIGSDTGLNQGLLGADLLLAEGRSLAVEGQLAVQQGQRLQLAQGGQLHARTLLLNGGSLTAQSTAAFTGSLDWQRGRLTLEGPAQQGQGLLATVPVLGADHQLRVEGRLTLDGATPLVLAGGQLDLDALRSAPGSAGLDWRSGQVTLRGDARLADGLPAQLVLGADKRLHVAGELRIDRGSQLLLEGGVLSFAVLSLDGGRLDLSASQALSGHFDWQQGTLALKGDVALSNPWLGGRTVLNQGRVLEVGGQLQLGGGQLNLAQGGVLVTRGLQGSGRVLLDGGVLRTETFGADTAARLAWQRGTLAITGDAGAALGQGGFKRMTVLDEGQTLQVSRTLSMARGTQLLLDGGQLRAGTVALQGGTLMTTEAPIDLSEVRSLQGHGLVSGAVQGGARTQLVAQGGTLTLGDADLAGGFVHAGELRVERGATALLLSADAAQLGRLTELQAGARLATLNGATLTHGGVMSFIGDATVQGEFTHQGRIEGSGGTLSFLNDVQGAGSFAGSVLFKAGYQPGNSPARIDFGGGRLSFGTNAVLTLEFFGPQPGTGYDQLMNIGWLDFQGTLNLQFDSSFKPVAGSRFQLFDFQQFSGSLSADRITVSGLDRQQLDLSQLGSTGQLQVSAVPEPGSWALMGLGLAVLAWRQRRRQPAQAQAARSNS